MRRTAESDQFHVRPWATVMRVPTDGNDVIFKANTPSLASEAAVVAVLSARRPDCVPPPLGLDLERGWMLMQDAGVALRTVIEDEHSLARWHDVLPLYAGLQVDMIDGVDTLLDAGAREMGLAVLPEKAEAMLAALEPGDECLRVAAAMPEIRQQCAALAAFGIPETIQHDDFHDAQVFLRDGRYALLDWGDACISHPFFSMAVTLDGVIQWGVDDVEASEDTAPFRDAYLAQFARFGDEGTLVEACTIARRLGWLCRAVNSHEGGGEPDEQILRRLRMFLDGRV